MSINDNISNALNPTDSVLRTLPIIYPSNSKIKIALIPMNLPIDQYFTKLQNGDFTLYQMETKYVTKITNLYRRYVKSACKIGARIICFSELSFPQQSKQLIKELAELSKQYNAYIIAGSHHDPDTCFNTSFVFTPFCRKPYSQYKINPAGRVGEKCKSPPNPQPINAWSTEFGIFTVLICLDIYDTENRRKLEYFNWQSYRLGIDMVVLPSYNPDQNMERLRIECSKLRQQSCIVYVNDMSQAPQIDCFKVFLPNGEAKLDEHPCPGCRNPFLLCEVNLEEIRNNRIEIIK